MIVSSDNAPHARRSVRLRDYDYTQPGAYFVTICAADKQCVFGSVNDGHVTLNNSGRSVEECWLAIPQHFPLARLDAHIVMPNHLHGVIVISHELVNPDLRGEAFVREISEYQQTEEQMLRPYALDNHPLGTVPGSVGAIVQNFKSVSTRKINKASGGAGVSVWQRNYYEHVIRDQRSLDDVRQYILANPWNWPQDSYHRP